MRLSVRVAALAIGAAACGGGDAPASAGSGSPSGGDDPGGGAELCETGRVGLSGSLAGEAVASSGTWMQSSFRDSLFQTFFQTRGRVILFGAAPLVEGGAEIAASGLFRMPAEAPQGGSWFCAGDGSSVARGGPEDRFRLVSISRLGGCPGVPVSGEVTACLGGGIGFCPRGPVLTSTIEGAAFDWTDSVTGWGGAVGLYEVRLDNGGVLTLDLDLDTVLEGLLLMPPGGPDPGAAYCFGAGAIEPGPDSGVRFTSSGLSRLGSCPAAEPVDGTIEGCSR